MNSIKQRSIGGQNNSCGPWRSVAVDQLVDEQFSTSVSIIGLQSQISGCAHFGIFTSNSFIYKCKYRNNDSKRNNSLTLHLYSMNIWFIIYNEKSNLQYLYWTYVTNTVILAAILIQFFLLMIGFEVWEETQQMHCHTDLFCRCPCRFRGCRETAVWQLFSHLLPFLSPSIFSTSLAHQSVLSIQEGFSPSLAFTTSGPWTRWHHSAGLCILA